MIRPEIIISTTDANDNTIHYRYNSRDKVCTITDQSGLTETFRYDKEGRQIEHISRNGTVTTTTYNIDGNPTLKACTDKKGQRYIMGKWEYDALGQLKKLIADGIVHTYERRADGKLLKKWDNEKLVLTCDYYREGSLKSLTDLSGHSTIYEYDHNSRLSCLKNETGAILAKYQYTAGGRTSKITTLNGLTTEYRYDSEGNLAEILLENTKSKELIYSASLYYDLCGNRTGRKGLRLGADGKQYPLATVFKYDKMNRLTEERRVEKAFNEAKRAWEKDGYRSTEFFLPEEIDDVTENLLTDGERYLYDYCGNRTQKETILNDLIDLQETCCYNEKNQLTERETPVGVIRYTYDQNGNLLSEKEGEKKAKEYRYDLLDRQTKITTAAGSTQENHYDGEGYRIGMSINGEAISFLFYNGEILAESDENGTPTRRYLHGIGHNLSFAQTLSDHA